MDAFIGMILPIPYIYAPQDWNYCGGQSIAVAQNQALYSLLGTNYGGNTTNFLLPNLVSRTMIGSYRMGPIPVGLSAHALTATGGTEYVQLNLQSLPTHTHAASLNSSSTMPVTVPITIASTSGSMSASLPVSTTIGTINTPTGANTILSATPGTGGTSAFMWGSVASTPMVPIAVSVSGAPAMPPQTQNVTFSIPSGISVGNAGSGAAVPSLPPFLALSFIIAMQGIYPMQPN